MGDARNLPRLERAKYQAFAVVFWTHTLEKRATGWLDKTFHHNFRELLLHAATREKLICPAYCLMPDHIHHVWMGLSLASDQLNAKQFLRKQLNRLLKGEELVVRTTTPAPIQIALQRQPHDHVLREEERQRNSFAKTCFYTLENPLRAGLAAKAQDWEFSGAVVPGLPTLWPFAEDYWPLFWKVYEIQREPTPTDPPKAL